MPTKSRPVPLGEVRAWVDSHKEWLLARIGLLDRNHPAVAALGTIEPDDAVSIACVSLATLTNDPLATGVAENLEWLACTVLPANDQTIRRREKKAFLDRGDRSDARRELADLLYDDTIELALENGAHELERLRDNLPIRKLVARRRRRAELSGDSNPAALTARLEQRWLDLSAAITAFGMELEGAAHVSRWGAAIFDEAGWAPPPTPRTLAAWNNCLPKIEERLANAGMSGPEIAELLHHRGSPDDPGSGVRNDLFRLRERRQRRRELFGLKA